MNWKEQNKDLIFRGYYSEENLEKRQILEVGQCRGGMLLTCNNEKGSILPACGDCGQIGILFSEGFVNTISAMFLRYDLRMLVFQAGTALTRKYGAWLPMIHFMVLYITATVSLMKHKSGYAVAATLCQSGLCHSLTFRKQLTGS